MTAGKRFLLNRDGFIVFGRDGFIGLDRDSLRLIVTFNKILISLNVLWILSSTFWNKSDSLKLP